MCEGLPDPSDAHDGEVYDTAEIGVVVLVVLLLVQGPLDLSDDILNRSVLGSVRSTRTLPVPVSYDAVSYTLREVRAEVVPDERVARSRGLAAVGCGGKREVVRVPCEWVLFLFPRAPPLAPLNSRSSGPSL